MAEAAVLFVCLGNICRSPLAEAALRQAAQAARRTITVDSAGTAAYHVGEPPDPRAVRTAARAGSDLSGYRARQVGPEDFARFTHILAADAANLRALRQIAPAGHAASVGLILDLVEGRAGEDLADPWYGDEAGFQDTWNDVTAAAHGLLARLPGPAA